MRGLASCRAGVLRASVSQRSPRTNKHPQEGAAQTLPLARLRGGRHCHVVPVSEPIRWQTHQPRGHGYSRKCNFISLPSSPLPPAESASCLGPSCRSGRLSPGWKAADRWTRRLLGAGTLTGKGRFSNPRWPSAPGCRAPSFKLLEGQPASASCTYLPGGLALWAGTGTWPRCPLPCPWGPCLGWKHHQGSEAWGLCSLAQSRPFQN